MSRSRRKSRHRHGRPTPARQIWLDVLAAVGLAPLVNEPLPVHVELRAMRRDIADLRTSLRSEHQGVIEQRHVLQELIHSVRAQEFVLQQVLAAVRGSLTAAGTAGTAGSLGAGLGVGAVAASMQIPEYGASAAARSATASVTAAAAVGANRPVWGEPRVEQLSVSLTMPVVSLSDQVQQVGHASATTGLSGTRQTSNTSAEYNGVDRRVAVTGEPIAAPLPSVAEFVLPHAPVGSAHEQHGVDLHKHSRVA